MKPSRLPSYCDALLAAGADRATDPAFGRLLEAGYKVDEARSALIDRANRVARDAALIADAALRCMRTREPGHQALFEIATYSVALEIHEASFWTQIRGFERALAEATRAALITQEAEIAAEREAAAR